MVDEQGVIVAGERINSKTVIWTAGVTPFPVADGSILRRIELGVFGSEAISPFRTIEIFVVGNTASLDQEAPFD